MVKVRLTHPQRLDIEFETDTIGYLFERQRLYRTGIFIEQYRTASTGHVAGSDVLHLRADYQGLRRLGALYLPSTPPRIPN